jgi:NodT family efflux transporter outer membrane factor (OMF) lipoprotein
VSTQRTVKPPALAGAVVASLLLVACAVGPDYKAPAAQLAAFHNVAAVGRGDAQLERWWAAFNDPILLQLEEMALAQNLDLAASIARVSQARATASAAGAQLLPTVDANTQASAYRQSLVGPIGSIARGFPGYDRDQRVYDVGAAASWEIDLFGGLRRGSEAARAEAQAAEADRMGVRVSVAADVADAYFRVRADQARLAVTQQQIDVESHLLDLVTQRRGHGVSSERELAQTGALLSSAQAVLPVLRIDLEAQLNRLDVLLGVQPGTIAKDLVGSTEIAAVPQVPAVGEPAEVLRRRPDVIAAERRVAAANARIGASLADYYPKVSLSGVLGFESLSSGNLFNSQAFQPVGTGAIRWRLFDFGRVRAEVAQARGADAEALARYQESVLHAAEDVENAFLSLQQTEVRTRALEAEVGELGHARELSQQAYSAGVIPLTDVLDADRLLLSARDDLAQSRANDARAAVRVYRSLGGGWSS